MIAALAIAAGAVAASLIVAYILREPVNTERLAENLLGGAIAAGVILGLS